MCHGRVFKFRPAYITTLTRYMYNALDESGARLDIHDTPLRAVKSTTSRVRMKSTLPSAPSSILWETRGLLWRSLGRRKCDLRPFRLCCRCLLRTRFLYLGFERGHGSREKEPSLSVTTQRGGDRHEHGSNGTTKRHVPMRSANHSGSTSFGSHVLVGKFVVRSSTSTKPTNVAYR